MPMTESNGIAAGYSFLDDWLALIIGAAELFKYCSYLCKLPQLTSRYVIAYRWPGNTATVGKII